MKNDKKINFTKSGNPVVHGKASSYNNHHCRCTDCTKAWAIYINVGGYVKKYREKKKSQKSKTGVRINL